MTLQEEMTQARKLAEYLRDGPGQPAHQVEKWAIIVEWLELEAEVLACYTTPPDYMLSLPSVRMARLLNGQWEVVR